MREKNMIETQISTHDFEDSIQVDISSAPSSSEPLPTFHEVLAKSCPPRNITVFQDRAEVNRVVELEVTAGKVEVVVKQLSQFLEEDSLRVTCFSEVSTILEVTVKSSNVVEEKIDVAEEKQKAKVLSDQLQSEIDALEKEFLSVKEKIASNQNEVGVLDSYAKCVTSSKTDKVVELLEKKCIDNMLNFLSVYNERSEKLIQVGLSLKEKEKSLKKNIDELKAKLALVQPKEEKFRLERNASVLLEVKESTMLKLVISYVVLNCGWTPFYDVRAFSKDNSVQILYFANIKQESGEDWTDTKLSLSTAMPSVGGTPPFLSTDFWQIKVEPQMLRSSLLPSKSRASRKAYSKIDRKSLSLDEREEMCTALSAPLPVAKVSESMMSTNFEITRLATIPSDGNDHKVSICQLDFAPEFEYVCVAKLSAHAFLKIKTKNESNYAMLSGNVNVFLDNNFLTKSKMNAVSPMEEFEVALGVDPLVKVTYKSLRKHQQTSGMINKSTVYNFHQQIEVKNTKQTAIKMKLIDQCPYSFDERIKVNLQEPEIKIPKMKPNESSSVTSGNVTLHTNENKIEWQLEIAANDTKVINLRYQMEHPRDKSIEEMRLS